MQKARKKQASEARGCYLGSLGLDRFFVLLGQKYGRCLDLKGAPDSLARSKSIRIRTHCNRLIRVWVSIACSLRPAPCVSTSIEWGEVAAPRREIPERRSVLPSLARLTAHRRRRDRSGIGADLQKSSLASRFSSGLHIFPVGNVDVFMHEPLDNEPACRGLFVWSAGGCRSPSLG